MIRFMICDTDRAFLDRLAAALHQSFDPCSVEYMYGPSTLEVSLRSDSGGADVLLTEIELRECSAIDIIAQYRKDSSPLEIIYMTSKMEFCTEVYDTPHCGLLLKPVEPGALLRNVRRALKHLERRKACGVVLQHSGSYHIVNAPALLYVESRGRIMRTVTDQENIESYGKLSSLLFQLDKRFLQCHKSYLVNMERVKTFLGDRFLMDNGAVVPISQSRRKAVKQEFLSYMGSAANRACGTAP